MFGLGVPEIIALCVVGVLLFGSRLPQVARHLAKGIKEFQSTMRGVEDQVEGSMALQQNVEPPRPPQRVVPAVPKFEGS